MITLRGVQKAYGGQSLFDGASLQINQDDRYALVGPNGAGKSTLFKMLLGEVEPDGGELQIRRGTAVGYLPQENPPLSELSVLDEALAHHDDPDGRQTAKAKAILMGLGFRVADFEKPVKALSGGWAMRVAMARLLLQEPDLLLLDEPTNHLDLESLLWFQEYLQGYPGAIFVISHDRAFINAICGAIVSVQNHDLKVYRGDYEAYLREREAEKQRLISAWTQQQAEIRDMEDFIYRNRARASTAGRAQSMIKRLDKLERIELPPDAKEIKIRFPQPQRTGVKVLSLKKVSKAYGPVKVYENLDFDLERGWKMAFVGKNGAGKSTLLKMLAGVIEADAGERVLGINVKVGYFSQHRAGQLDMDSTVLKEALNNDRMNAEMMVRTVLGTFLFPGDSVYKKIGVLSGGEKSRVALVKLLLDPPNVLLLDEPTTHLDMASVEALIGALKEFEGTICTISHDVHFLNSLADHVVHVEDGKVTVYPGNYEYFQRRQAQKLAEAGPAAAKAAAPAPVVEAPVKRDNSKRIEKLKKEAAASAVRLEELAGQLSDPALYEDYAKVQAIGDEMHQVQERMAELEAEVERLAA
ncbi:MAG TPA: ABC-F family ATP-binding cassette domain-containing protein [Elusimicrobiota bacterium]|nr:ABC-F family ATP-binding cassette domain-containing protein [Elusimicrobiota bacterium]